MWFVDLLISLLLTAVFYTGPILIYRFVIRQESLEKKHSIIICLISGIVLFAIMEIIAISITNTGANVTACVCWSVINYYILVDRTRNNSNYQKIKDDKALQSCSNAKNENILMVKKESSVEIFMNMDSSNVEGMLKRAFIFIEDGLFEKADRHLEIVLDQDPENAKAYIGKLLVDLRLKKEQQLEGCDHEFENNANYQRALKYADNSLKNILIAYEEKAKQYRDEKFNKYVSSLDKTEIYLEACRLMSIDTLDSQQKALELFEKISDWNITNRGIFQCKKRIVELKSQNHNDSI